MAAKATVEVKVADAEPVRRILRATTEVVSTFCSLAPEERALLPAGLRTKIGILLEAWQAYSEPS